MTLNFLLRRRATGFPTSRLGGVTAVAVLVAFAALAACSSGAATETPPASPTAVGSTSVSPTPASTETAQTPEVQRLQLVIAVSDLAVGPGNRLAFALIGPEGPIKLPSAAAQLVFLGGGRGQSMVVNAVFRPWPVGLGGLYSASVDFERAGDWGMEVRVFLPGGVIGVGRTQLSVATAGSAPALGVRPPASRNKTSADFTDPEDASELAKITSSEVPDPDLYRMTVAEALDSGLPSIVSFATPAFCQTATCGPQVEVITALKERHSGQANFIHIEVYDSPDKLTDLSRARLVPQMAEWGLLTEPYTFVLDGEGRVAAKFEGFVNEDELAEALAAVLGP
jgi:hypothetical protein